MANRKFMYNGIKIDGVLHKGSYSGGSLRGYPEGTITIYANRRFPKMADFEIQNDTDTQTDYFDDDKIRVTPDHPAYAEVKAAYVKQNEKHRIHAEKMQAKLEARRAQVK